MTRLPDVPRVQLHQVRSCSAIWSTLSIAPEATAIIKSNRSSSLASHPLPVEAKEHLEAVTFNVVIGNGDAHSKNYSVMIDRDGSVALAPIYDAARRSTLILGTRAPATSSMGKTSVDSVDVEDLVGEAASWGTSERRARAAVGACMERLHAAVDQVPLPSGAEQVKANLENLWMRRSWPAMRRKTFDEDGSRRGRCLTIFVRLWESVRHGLRLARYTISSGDSGFRTPSPKRVTSTPLTGVVSIVDGQRRADLSQAASAAPDYWFALAGQYHRWRYDRQCPGRSADRRHLATWPYLR